MEEKFVLVTGAAGFIGSHLCRKLLSMGYRVIGVDSLVCGFLKNITDCLEDPRFYFIQKDIRYLDVDDIIISTLKENIATPIVFHLAARGELYFCRDNPEEAVDNNINGTIQMLKLSQFLSCKKFIFADTSAEYDNVPTCIIPQKVSDAPNGSSPMGIYAITKMAAAQFCRSWFKHRDLNVNIVRPFNVYGPSLNIERDIPPVIGNFAKMLLQNKDVTIYGDGNQRRDFIYISDAIDLLIKLMESNVKGRTYNMGTGINYSVLELYELVSNEIFGPNGNRPGILYALAQPGEAQITLADISRSKRELGWYPKVEIEEGIKLTVDSLRREII